MLLTREEMSFDFAGAKLDPVRDREILAWMFNQFLYGEITGIQIGHWLYDAPDVESARFLARQAVEEFQHVDNFLRIMAMLGCEPQRVNPVVAFLATGMMGETWAEHVALEMAAGEGFVLMAFYAMIDTLDHDGVVEILKRAVRQEERHVDFGEKQTMKLIAGKPWLRRRLLGLSLVSLWGVKRLARFMASRLPADHPVLSRLPEFLGKTTACAELRLRRIGLLDRPLAELGTLARAALIAEAYAQKAGSALWRLVTWPVRLLPFVGKKRRLTDTYLDDPLIRALPPAPGGTPATDEA
jgi:bacterioferritin (cytochrome b1)